jgi:flagellar protein FliO/FliZ
MEEVSILRFILAFAFVLALIGLFGVGMRKWGGRITQIRSGGARLAVVESCYIGPKHRLLLVKRDGVEHLLLIGPNAPLVVESGIGGKKE